MLARLLDAGAAPGPRLRAVLLGGAPADRALLTRARDAGWPVAPTYGLTQACSQVTVGEVGDVETVRPRAAGRHRGARARRRDPRRRPDRGRRRHPAHRRPRPPRRPRPADRHRPQGGHDRQRRRERGAGRGRGGAARAPGRRRRRRVRAPAPGVGGGGDRARGAASRRHRARAARVGRRSGWPASRCRRRSRSPMRSRAPRPASCCDGSWREPRPTGRESRRRWERYADAFRARTMAVSTWMVDAIAPQPGHTILDLAAGVGDTGFLAAELIEPGGTLITSDVAPEMLSAAQRRAAALGLRNVRFRQIDPTLPIDLAVASVDGVLCRWGYMLMDDPEAAVRETRRVLRPGGRLALAAWTDADENRWSSLPVALLLERGLAEPPEPGPGQFAWARRGRHRRAPGGRRLRRVRDRRDRLHDAVRVGARVVGDHAGDGSHRPARRGSATRRSGWPSSPARPPAGRPPTGRSRSRPARGSQRRPRNLRALCTTTTTPISTC